MSIAVKTKAGTTVTVGGEHDQGGERGKVTLTIGAATAQLTPAETRAVARKLERFADRARPTK